MKQQIEAIVFDLGGVLIDWNPRYLYRKLIVDDLKIEDFLTRVCHSEWNSRQDAGRPFSEGIKELTALFPEHELLIRAYFERWEEMLSGPIQGTVDVLNDLSRQNQHKLMALSNWSAETFPIALRRFPFLQSFEAILVSGEEKLIKPDPAFFALLEHRYGVVPSRTVFIDDLEKNIAAAKRLGFVAIQFHDPSQLRHELGQMGILREN